MLTEEDVLKLKEVLVTKDDFKGTNQQILDTKEGLKKIDEKIAGLLTLDEFNSFKKENDEKLVRLLTLEEFDNFKKENNENSVNLRESIQALTVSVDKLVKLTTDAKQEEIMVKNKFDRHDRWFQIIADKLGIKLEY